VLAAVCNHAACSRVSLPDVEDEVQGLLRARRYGEAFERLLDRHVAQVFRMAVMMLRDHGRAEEVTQDVFLQFWRVLPRYDGRAAPSTWLYAMARNACLSALRAAVHRRTSSLDDVPEPAAPRPVPVDAMDICQFVSRLPDVQREVVTLFYLQERSLREVALGLDMPEGTVKSHLHRSRQALAKMMQERRGE
jgi:RNA polymerase sigma-70 factor (ECF subfamily)